MLQLLTPTPAKFKNSSTLSQKNRPTDERPGAKIILEVELSADYLDELDPSIRGWAFEAPPKGKPGPGQASLEGVVPASATPHLTAAAQKISKIGWHYDLTGYHVTLIRGTGHKLSNVELEDCILRFPSIAFKEGGTFVGKVEIESGNVPGHAWEKFAELKSRPCEVMLKAPDLTKQKQIAEAEQFEAGVKASIAKDRKPGAAERAAVAKAGKGPAAKTPHKTKAVPRGTLADADAKAAKTAQKNGAGASNGKTGVEQSQPGTRTARGRDKTKAAIDKGLEAAAADGQVKH
jgi:hypothetical protein